MNGTANTKFKMRNAIFIAWLILCNCLAIASANGTPDSHIKKALDDLKLQYTVDNDGDHKLTISTSDNRTQQVFIDSNISRIGVLEVRRVWSAVHQSATTLTEEKAAKLLQANSYNGKYKGAFSVVSGTAKHVIIYSANIPANASKSTLQAAILLVAHSADKFEMEFSKEDLF